MLTVLLVRLHLLSKDEAQVQQLLADINAIVDDDGFTVAGRTWEPNNACVIEIKRSNRAHKQLPLTITQLNRIDHLLTKYTIS